MPSYSSSRAPYDGRPVSRSRRGRNPEGAEALGAGRRDISSVTISLAGKWPYIAGITLLLAFEFALRDLFLPPQPSDLHIGIALIAEWLLLAALVLIWIPRVEGKRLDSVGMGHRRWRYLWLGALVYLIVLAAMMLSGFVLESVGLSSIRSLQPVIKGYGLATLLGLLVTGTFLEEVFYRGYLMERLILLTGKVWVAAVSSWLAFTFVHLRFFGLGPTLDIGVLSAALVLLYVKERSIWPCVVVHGINNILAYIIFPLTMA